MAADVSVAIALEGVSKGFGTVAAVRDVTLSIGEGEFFSLLGPSGCGKTTTLRMIAGFEVPDEGRIVLQTRDVTSVSANRRPVNMVFQHYALFPHMSIYDNVAFGLKVKRVPRSEHPERIKEMLRVVELEGLERRRIRQLSGGQQQRVALARALVNRPAALLLDEPLGALDVKLRKQMQLELKRIQSELGTTFIYVTHDQQEALATPDRLGRLPRHVHPVPRRHARRPRRRPPPRRRVALRSRRRVTRHTLVGRRPRVSSLALPAAARRRAARSRRRRQRPGRS